MPDSHVQSWGRQTWLPHGLGATWREVEVCASGAGEAAALGNQKKEREGNTVCEAVHPGNFLSLESQQAGVSSLGRRKQSLRQGFRCT